MFEDSLDRLAEQIRHLGIGRQSESEMDRILHRAFRAQDGSLSARNEVDTVRDLEVRSPFDSVNNDFSVMFPRHLGDPSSSIREAGFLSTTGIERVLEGQRRFDRILEDQRRFDRILEEQRQLERFYRPPALEATMYASQFMSQDTAIAAFLRHNRDGAGFASMLDRIERPWIDSGDALTSVRGMAGLRAIGLSVHDASPFSDSISATLRSCVGDWRGDFHLPALLRGMTAPRRSGIYVSHGFDPAVSSFPPEVLHEAVIQANLEVPEAEPSREDEDREVFAFRTLRDVEIRLRRFIENEMSCAHGSDWPETRLPAKLRKRWHATKEKAVRAGEKEQSLINYADFQTWLR